MLRRLSSINSRAPGISGEVSTGRICFVLAAATQPRTSVTAIDDEYLWMRTAVVVIVPLVGAPPPVFRAHSRPSVAKRLIALSGYRFGRFDDSQRTVRGPAQDAIHGVVVSQSRPPLLASSRLASRSVTRR
ncbi:hypothetical protein LSAT2_030208 [Lamellibrachia satsuma]|nr:hypothetical protein LSAT2_030208 [Lamellibrachia satsuma]